MSVIADKHSLFKLAHAYSFECRSQWKYSLCAMLNTHIFYFSKGHKKNIYQTGERGFLTQCVANLA